MKTMITALTLIVSVAYLSGCDAVDDGDIEALQAQIDDEDAGSRAPARSDDEDVEDALSLEASQDLVGHSSAAPKTCAQWTPNLAQCEKANILCLDYDLTPGWCEILTQCIKCGVPVDGGV